VRRNRFMFRQLANLGAQVGLAGPVDAVYSRLRPCRCGCTGREVQIVRPFELFKRWCVTPSGLWQETSLFSGPASYRVYIARNRKHAASDIRYLGFRQASIASLAPAYIAITRHDPSRVQSPVPHLAGLETVWCGTIF
jgi:hypothetical protein